MLKMKETPQENATMMTTKVMRKRRTSFIMLFIERIMGPKYLEAMPTWKERDSGFKFFHMSAAG
jgi:hypothetical protein